MHDCPARCGRSIPDEMYLCNVDAHRTPDELIVAYAQAWDTRNAVAQQAVMKAILKVLGVRDG